MAEEQESPEPAETGADGTQLPASETSQGNLIPHTAGDGQRDSIFPETISGLAVAKYRSMGGEAAAALIAGWSHEKANELSEIKFLLNSSRGECNQLIKDYGNERVKSAVLQERLNSESRTKHLRNFCIFSGTTLLGLAFALPNNSQTGYSVVLGLLGFALLLFGWFSSPKREK